MADDQLDASAAVDAYLASSTPANLKTSLALTAGQNPDYEAETRRLGQQLGLPPQTVASNIDDARKQASLATFDADSYAQQFPTAAKFLADPNNAAIAHDDKHALANTEQLLTPQVSAWNPSMGERLTSWWHGLFGVPQIQQAQAMNAFASGQLDPALHGTAPTMTPGDARDAVGGMSEVPDQAVSKGINMASFGLLPDTAGDATTTAGQIGGAAGSLGGFLIGGPLKAADMLLGHGIEHVAGESFAKGLGKDVVNQGAKLGVATGLSGVGNDINSPDVATGLNKFANDTASGAGTGAVFGTAGRILPDNTVAQAAARIAALNFGLDAVNGTSPVDTVENWNTLTDSEKTDKLFNYGLNTLFGLTGAGRAEGGWFHDNPVVSLLGGLKQSGEAQQGFERLTALGQTAAQSKLRERDPAAFKDFVAQASENSDIPAVYVDASKLNDVLNQAGVNTDQLRQVLPDVADQMHEALQTNGTVRIPTEDYLTHIAGGPLEQSLLPEMRIAPGGKTFSEVQDETAQQNSQLSDMAQKIADKKTANDAFEQSRQSVFDAVHKQVMDTRRFNPDVANTYAALHRDFFTVLGDHLKMTPEEAYQQHGARVVGEDLGGGQFEQGSSLRDAHTWKAVGENAAGPLYKGNGFTLDPVAKLPHETDFDAGGFAAHGLMGHAAHVPEGATPYLFSITKGGGKLGKLVASVKNGNIVAIHDIEAYDKNKGLGTSVVAHIAANSPEGVHVIEAIDQAKGFWNERGTTGFDQYNNGHLDWQGVEQHLNRVGASRPGRTIESNGDGTQDFAGSPGAGGIESRELSSEEIDQLESQGFRFNQSVRTKQISKRDDYTQDLFGNTLPENPGADTPSKRPARRSATAAVPTDAPPGTYATHTKLVQENTRTLGANKVTTPEEAAHATAYLGKGAVERFDALVTDKNGKPLAVVGAFKGAITQTAVYPATVLAEAFRVPGAANIWFSHNHPSGKPDLSSADRTLYSNLHNAFQGSGIEPRGILAVTSAKGGKQSWTYGGGAEAEARGDIIPKRETADVPVMERHFTETDTLGESISSPGAAIQVADKVSGGNSGVLMLNAQNEPIAFVPVAAAETIPLRQDGRMDSLYRAMSEANPNAVMIVNHGDYSQDQVRNLAAFFNNIDTRTLDVLQKTPGETGGLKSWAAQGIDFSEKRFRQDSGSTAARGFYSPESRTIGLLKNADLSTFVHESGHFFLDTYARIAADPEAPVSVKADMDSILKWLGVDSLDHWHSMSIEQQRDAHEQFARGFESYLMEGKAPNLELQTVFARVKSWMLNVYQSLKNLSVDLNPEVRGVFDRMLASERTIREAESARVFEPLWTEKPEGADDEAWQSYQQSGQEATQEAIDAMQAKSIKDMRWLSNAKDRAIKMLQREANGVRSDIRMQVRKEVMSQPVYRAWDFLTRKLTADDKLPALEEPKSNPDRVDPGHDSLFKAIAKLGGIKKDEAMSEWGVDPKDAPQSGLFGKPVLRVTGGLSLERMAEALAEHGYLSRDENGKHDLNELLDKFHAEMGGDTQHALAYDYAAHQDKRAGDQIVNPLGLDAARIDAHSLREMGVDDHTMEVLKARKMVSDNGLHPDVIADIIHDANGNPEFNSGTELIHKLAEAPAPRDEINRLTDQRMLEQHGELTTPDAIARTAEELIHNDARARFMATGLKILAKSAIPVRQLVKGAIEAAEAAVARKKVRDLSYKQYAAAESRSNKEAIKLAPKDPAGAVKAQRAALLNNRLVKATMDAQDDVRRAVTYFKRFDKDSIRKKLPGQFLERIDALLDQFDFRQSPSLVNRPKETLLTWANGLREAGYEPQIADWLHEFNQPTHYKDLTVEQMRGLYDTVRSIEATAKNLREIMRNGKIVSLESAVHDLVAKMDQRGEKFTKDDLINPPMAKVDGIWKSVTHWLAVRLRMVDTDLLPQEYKTNRYDMHQLDGPFREMLLAPMFEANYRKVDMTKAVSDAAGKVGQELGAQWQKQMFNLVDNQTLLDPRLSEPGKPVMMKITRAKLLGLMRHLGNESNFDKLTKGYGWNPNDVWRFVMKNATQKDWLATQAHWDSFDPLWVKTEEMVRRIGGVAPPKIPAREFDTPFGKMRGGYSPIDYDPMSSKLSVNKGEFDLGAGDKVGGNILYRATSTSNSSLNNRVQGYTDFVNLDIHSADSRIRDTIHDLAYREALLDVAKITDHPDFREKFMLTYGREEYQALKTWMKDIRDMYLIDPRNRGFENAMQYSRQGVVMTGIAYRFSTVIKHGSSAALKSLGYLGPGGGAKYFAARVTRMASGHLQEDIAGAKEKFAEIRTRMLQIDRDYKEHNRSMYEGEDWRAKNDRFGHAMVAWSDALSAVPTAWAAYDMAKTSGIPESMGGTGKPLSETQAVAYANSVVRQAHGTALETARSNFMQAKGAPGLFGTIYGFMNNSYGQSRDMYDKAFTRGNFNNNPALVARAMATLIMPALVAHWVSHGSADDSKGESWYHWTLMAIGAEAGAMVPFVRDATATLTWDHTDNSVAPLRLLLDAAATGKDIYKEVSGGTSKIIQDMANTIGEWAHIGGLGQAGKSLQYLRDVQNGKQHPQNAADYAQGMTIGIHKH